MSVAYTGTAKVAVIDVIVTDGVATKIETKVGEDAETLTVDLQLDLTNKDILRLKRLPNTSTVCLTTAHPM